jgi:multicomponent Na+:H+ antiporter subunit G
MTVTEVVASVLMLSGVVFALLAGIGLVRFEGVYARMHAATKPATLGLALVFIGAAFAIGEWSATAKLLLAVGFEFLTAPIGAHLIGRAAHRADADESMHGALDELREP